MRKISKPILTDHNIRLRPLTADDALAMFGSLDEPEANRLTGIRARHSLQEVQDHCARIKGADDRADCAILVRDELTGEVVLNRINGS